MVELDVVHEVDEVVHEVEEVVQEIDEVELEVVVSRQAVGSGSAPVKSSLWLSALPE